MLCSCLQLPSSHYLDLVNVNEVTLLFTGWQWCRGVVGPSAKHFIGSTSSRNQCCQIANTAGVFVGYELLRFGMLL